MPLELDSLLQKIKYLLVGISGKLPTDASCSEFYYALSLALREEIMINIVSNYITVREKRGKIVYYISMEHLPGKLLENNISNMNFKTLILDILKKTNRSYEDLKACDPELGLGNGGLGRLASCFMDSLATQKYTACAYGLRYQYGIFEQEIWNGVQIERPDCWLLTAYPWEIREDSHAQSVFYRGRPLPGTNSHGDQIFQLEDYEEVRAVPYNIPIIGYSETNNIHILPLRLWSTKESPHNFALQRYNAGQLDQAAENTTLTDVLYPNDNNETGKRIRLKQEFLLVSASLKDILQTHLQVNGDISSLEEKVQIQINDTHPALIIAELMRVLTKDYDIPWKHAYEITQNCCNYTNHTVLREALEEWNEMRVAYLLPRQYQILQRMNQDFCNLIRKKFPNDEDKVRRMTIIHNGQIRMAHLAIYGCKKINGVAELHTELLKKKLFKDFYDMYPEKFLAITNGVTPRRWLFQCNPLLSDFITKRIGKSWITDFPHIKEIAKFASDKESQEEFLSIKKANKERLIEFLSLENPVRDFKGKIIRHSNPLGSDALFDVHVKRFHEYKRQLMLALHTIMVFQELKENPSARKIKRMIIIGGKAAPGYELAKNIIRLFFCIIRKINFDDEISHLLRVSFVENYNVSKGELIFPAADLSEQISTAGTEASGTGNMKFAMNGALTIGTEDGANIEMRKSISDAYWPFSFGLKTNEIDQLHTNPGWEIYSQNAKVRKALDALQDGSLSINDSEQAALSQLFYKLVDPDRKVALDPYFIIKDLMPYYETQKKVEELYITPNKWAEYAIQNMAGMGPFSSDVAIKNYAEKIWNTTPFPIDPEIRRVVREEFE
ncbi:MAG: glycogen/starch/alpha-glucan family phosphorylase [Chlamydiota bacterium]